MPELRVQWEVQVDEVRNLCLHIEVSHLISHLVAVASIEVTIKRQ
jgi:hypothetical protein